MSIQVKVAGACLALAVGTALAGGPDHMAPPVSVSMAPMSHQNGIYLGVGGGISFADFNGSFNNSTWRNDDSLSSFSKLPSTWDNASGVMRAFVGWNFLDYLGVEAAYNYYNQHTWEATAIDISSNTGSYKVRMDNSALQLMGKIHYNIQDFDVSVLAGAALRMADDFRVTNNAPSPAQVDNFNNKNFWTFAYGASFAYYLPMVNGLAVSLDYRGMLGKKGVSLPIKSGTNPHYRAPMRNDIMLGVNYLFNI